MSLQPFAREAAEILKARKQHVAAVESTTGGLIGAALLSCPGASSFYVSSCVVYSRRGYKQFLPESLLTSSGINERQSNYSGKDNYIRSKLKFVEEIAKNSSNIVASDWFICESGTVGPEFYIPGVTNAFTAVAVKGPNGFLKSTIFESNVKDREENMWIFTHLSLQFFTECLRSHQAHL